MALDPPPSPPTPDRMQRRLAAILAADVVGYSRLMAADEDGTHSRLKALRKEVLDPAIAAHQGRLFKTMGDGFLVEFPSAVDAVSCAAALQAQLAARNQALPEAHRLALRIGVNLGDVIIEDGDLHGDGVNVAARLEALAEPGSVYLSSEVHGQVERKLKLAFDALGDQKLKNIDRPVAVYRLAPPKIEAPMPEAPSAGAAGLAMPEKPSIAVLPFQNMSGDPEQEYFADGMVEDIITALSRFKELFVIARNSSFAYKGAAIDIQKVARELGVRYVLEGSVRKAGSRVRITGQLIDTATRAHLWADKIDGALEDVFELQDRVTESVVGALQPSLRQAEIERARRKHPASLDAYDYLLRALPLVIANSTSDAPEAIRLLEEALRLDPNYAFAHALMANAYGQTFRAAPLDQRAALQAKGLDHARQAIALAGDDAAPLAEAGFVLVIMGNDPNAARAALDRAVALNANSAAALTYRSLVLAMIGETQGALDDAARAQRLSPVDPAGFLSFMGIAIARYQRDEFDAMAEANKKAMEINPRYPMSYAWLVVAECARGDKAAAEAVLARLVATLPGFQPQALPNLFAYFPPPLRAKVFAHLAAAGLAPAT